MSICTSFRKYRKRERKGIREIISYEDITSLLEGSDKQIIDSSLKTTSPPSKASATTYLFNPVLAMELKAFLKNMEKASDLIFEFENLDKQEEFGQAFKRNPIKAIREYSGNIIYAKPFMIDKYHLES